MPASVHPAGPSAAPNRRPQSIAEGASAREAQERGMVLGLVGAFTALGLLAGGYQLVRSTRLQSAQYDLNKALTAVSNRQSEFRTMTGRFASWPELQRRGVRLEAQQVVTEWNADSSHWFLAVRDRKTGIVCQRTGEMFDDGRPSRRTSCTSK